VDVGILTGAGKAFCAGKKVRNPFNTKRDGVSSIAIYFLTRVPVYTVYAQSLSNMCYRYFSLSRIF
jgi:hypothetical protein